MTSFLGLFDPSLENESPDSANCSKPSKHKNNNQRKNKQGNVGKRSSKCNSPERVLSNSTNKDVNSNVTQLNNFSEEATRRRSTVNMLDKYNDWAREKQSQQRIHSNKNTNVINSTSSKSKNTFNKKSKTNKVAKINNNAKAALICSPSSNCLTTNDSPEISTEASNTLYQNASLSLSKSLNISKVNENVVRIGSCLPEERISDDHMKTDVNKDTRELDGEDTSLPDQLPSEPQEGNIEYKLKLLNPNQERLKRLVSQVS